ARRGELLGAAREALARAAEGLPDLVLAANGARAAAESLGRLAGKVYADDLLDSLFSRFCIGK
ncbi:MAG: tRNA uridine-5-carboxymethylaminomethyl(34) synthesis GTPase MnmE, partial [Kiritimatiellae bacterium]|nr:tRNA uridine-5-carboxymethylaminomethyl(34) synthesis GTPase MnmE [Kiritimatiellia bacterium]